MTSPRPVWFWLWTVELPCFPCEASTLGEVLAGACGVLPRLYTSCFIVTLLDNRVSIIVSFLGSVQCPDSLAGKSISQTSHGATLSFESAMAGRGEWTLGRGNISTRAGSTGAPVVPYPSFLKYLGTAQPVNTTIVGLPTTPITASPLQGGAWPSACVTLV